MGILQPDIPVRRMANERKTKLTDALVQILCRLLTFFFLEYGRCRTVARSLHEHKQ